ncbi:MAG: methyl-accepting chemotaxis protein [Gammaproteobacteria bacterium]|nr:methyl-accepting chemotaxis protein [Gammaproteobacteria bacterium]
MSDSIQTNQSLAKRFIVPVVIGFLITQGIQVAVFGVNWAKANRSQGEAVSEELSHIFEQNRLDHIAFIEEKTSNIAGFLSLVSPDFLLMLDMEHLETLEKLVMRDPDIVYARFVDLNGEPMTTLSKPLFDESSVRKISRPVTIEGDKLGDVWIWVSSKRIDDLTAEKLAHSNQTFDELKQNAVDLQQSSMILVSVEALLAAAVLAMLSFISFRRSILKPLEATREGIERIKGGDLTVRLPQQNDELGELNNAVNHLTESLQQLVSTIYSEQALLGEQAATLGEAGDQLDKTAEDQDQTMSTMRRRIQDLLSSQASVQTSAAQASQATVQSNEHASSSAQTIEQALSVIHSVHRLIEGILEPLTQLETQSEQIASNIDAIRGVAEKTNFVALNASIEASRAGPAGAGFSVVAEEVRQLSTITRTYSAEVEAVIEQITKQSMALVSSVNSARDQADSGIRSAKEATQALTTIMTALNQIFGAVRNIEEHTGSQTKYAETVFDGLDSVERAANAGRELTAHCVRTAKHMTELTQRMQSVTKGYKVS